VNNTCFPDCTQFEDCSSCINSSYCGWCEDTFQCTYGDEDNAICLRCVNWSFGPDSCNNSCIDDCSGNGLCREGLCICDPNYSSDNCSIYTPPLFNSSSVHHISSSGSLLPPPPPPPPVSSTYHSQYIASSLKSYSSKINKHVISAGVSLNINLAYLLYLCAFNIVYTLHNM